MTVTTSAVKVVFTGNGLSTSFDFSFKVLAESDIVVYLYTAATKELVEVNPSLYNVTIAETGEGGQVVYPLSGEPLPSTQQLVIYRERPFRQEVNLSNQTRFFPTVVMEGLDNLSLQIQQVQEQVSRAVKFRVTDPDGPAKSETFIDDLEEAILRAELAAAQAEAAAQLRLYGIAFSFDGDGVATTTTLPVELESSAQLLIVVNGEVLRPEIDYTVDGDVVTLAVGGAYSAWPVGTDNVTVILQQPVQDAEFPDASTRAWAEGFSFPAGVVRLVITHNGINCRYVRDAASSALVTNGGTVNWGPDPAFATFLQHYGVTTYSSINAALAAGAAMTSGERVAEQARLSLAAGEMGGELIIYGFVEVYDKLILSPARTVKLARDPSRDGLVVSSRFNMAATSIIQGGTLVSDGADVESLHIWCDQPAAPANRAALNQYPRAFDIAGITRGRIGYLRISAAWDGLIGDGNCGGWDIGLVEYGAFNQGVYLDGALDTVNVRRLHSWRYGFASNSTLQAIHDDGTTVDIRLGRMDGLVIDSALTYRGKVVVDDATGLGLRIHIKSLMLDGDRANLELGRGKSLITLAYGTEALSAPQQSYKILCTDGEHDVNESDLISDATPTVEVNGGYLRFNGKLFNSNLTVGQGATVAAGTLVLDRARLAWPTGARSVPFIEQSGTGTLVMLDCAVEADTTGEVVRFNTDQPGNYVDRTRLGKHTVTMPSGAHRGNYGRNQRQDLVARCADGWRAVPGQVIYADGLAYIGSAGATTISDLPGLLPHGFVSPDHFGGKTRAAISAAWTYWNTLCTTTMNADVPAATAVPFRFVAGQYGYDSTSALSLETAGSRQRVEWGAGAICRGVQIRLRNRWCELIDPYLTGHTYDMDYGVAYQPDEGLGLRGAYLQNPRIIGIQNAAKTAAGLKVYGDATHLSVMGGRLQDSDFNFWWDNRETGDSVSGVLMTGTHLLGARVNNIRGGSISESKFNNLRIRQAGQEGVLLTPTAAGESLLECYFTDCSITGNHTDLTTRTSYAITGITDNGGKARLAIDLSGDHLLWAGLRGLSIRNTGIVGYDEARKPGITAITTTYVDTDLDYAGDATGTLYHCGWDARLEGVETGGTPLLARVNDVQFTGGNINSLGLFYVYNASFFGTRLKVNAFARNCNRITRVGGFRGRAEEVSDEPTGGTWSDVPIVGQATGIFEIGQSVGSSATRDTVPTGVMRMPLASAGLSHNRPNSYAALGVNSSTGVTLDGPAIINGSRTFLSPREFGAVGDGVADDSAALTAWADEIRATLADAAEEPQVGALTGYLPDGVYNCASPLAITLDKYHFAIRGQSRNAVLKNVSLEATRPFCVIDGITMIGTASAPHAIKLSGFETHVRNAYLYDYPIGVDMAEDAFGIVTHTKIHRCDDGAIYRGPALGHSIVHSEITSCIRGVTMNGGGEFKMESTRVLGNSEYGFGIFGAIGSASNESYFSNCTFTENGEQTHTITAIASHASGIEVTFAANHQMSRGMGGVTISGTGVVGYDGISSYVVEVTAANKVVLALSYVSNPGTGTVTCDGWDLYIQGDAPNLARNLQFIGNNINNVYIENAWNVYLDGMRPFKKRFWMGAGCSQINIRRVGPTGEYGGQSTTSPASSVRVSELPIVGPGSVTGWTSIVQSQTGKTGYTAGDEFVALRAPATGATMGVNNEPSAIAEMRIGATGIIATNAPMTINNGGLSVSGLITGGAVQSSQTDVTAGRLLPVGAYGWGGALPLLTSSDDLNTLTTTGMYRWTSSSVPTNAPGAFFSVLTHYQGSTGRAIQTVTRMGNSTANGLIYTRTNDFGTWQPWQVFYCRANIVATVGESGGIPTGGIIERGSGANGQFTRYADGTMECWHVLAASAGAAVTWTYPSAFVAASVPTVSGVVVGTTAASVMLDAAPTNTAATFSARDAASARRADTVHIRAVGRWF